MILMAEYGSYSTTNRHVSCQKQPQRAASRVQLRLDKRYDWTAICKVSPQCGEIFWYNSTLALARTRVIIGDIVIPKLLLPPAFASEGRVRSEFQRLGANTYRTMDGFSTAQRLQASVIVAEVNLHVKDSSPLLYSWNVSIG